MVSPKAKQTVCIEELESAADTGAPFPGGCVHVHDPFPLSGAFERDQVMQAEDSQEIEMTMDQNTNTLCPY
jgi:hypothetical protein